MPQSRPDTDTEGSPSAQIPSDGMVRLDFGNEVHAKLFESMADGVLVGGSIEFVVIDGELWTDDKRLIGGK